METEENTSRLNFSPEKHYEIFNITYLNMYKQNYFRNHNRENTITQECYIE